MVRAVNLGYPRIGAHRELKRAIEAYWLGDLVQEELRETGRALREEHWKLQQAMGFDHIPSNDFSYYDQVLDAAVMVGAVPERFGLAPGEPVGLDTYFAMARGLQEKEADAGASGAAAMEMTKWFDTNYHYIVPELHAGQTFELAPPRPVEAFEEAKALGVHTRPVLVGPVSFLLLSKAPNRDAEPLALLDGLLPVYEELLQRLAAAGATDVQLDEPFLTHDLESATLNAYRRAYERLSSAAPGLALHLATYFGGLRANLRPVLDFPVASVHLDLVRAPEQLGEALAHVPDGRALSLGLIDGRNVWRAGLDELLATAQKAVQALGPERVLIGPSCSLQHVPVDLDTEQLLDETSTAWLAFARQKLEEIAALVRTANAEENDAAERVFEASRAAHRSRAASERVHDPAVQERLAGITEGMLSRESAFGHRRAVQQEKLGLPLLPTTTIGSFPQTTDVRKKRSEFRKGNLDGEAYERFIESTIADTIRRQEALGLDVLVHGESERSDMAEYFGQRLKGFLFTQNGWVQSYGSRCVRPPIVFGDVSRPAPMTVRWTAFAQNQTDRPIKGLASGPVTLLQWSFVRDDQPHAVTCRQIALAIRDEVADLEAAGIGIIQIDEPALREGLPPRPSDREEYLDWAVGAFRLASGGADDATQIHTHMCYASFGDILQAIADMDADVISIESSRAKMEGLEAFAAFEYPSMIGPGVYDTHSPRVPSEEEIASLIGTALDVLPADRVWINPDCGLKTRRWKEVEPALRRMVEAARAWRERVTAAEGARADGAGRAGAATSEQKKTQT